MALLKIEERYARGEYAPDLRHAQTMDMDRLQRLAAQVIEHGDWLRSVVDRIATREAPPSDDWVHQRTTVEYDETGTGIEVTVQFSEVTS